MAKTKTNKSQAVRDYLAANQDAKGADVVKALAAKGIKVSAQMVSNIRSKSKGGGPAFKGMKPRKSKASKASSNGSAADVMEAGFLLVGALGPQGAKDYIDKITTSLVRTGIIK